MAVARTMDGGCLCGSVRFTAAPSETEVTACHCGMCRRWTGGPFLGVRCDDAVTIVSGEDQLAAYASSEWGERVFCRTCGSTLFWRMRETKDTEVAFGAFDDPSPFSLRKEIFIDAKPAGYSFADDTEKLTGAELMAQMAKRTEGQ